MIKAKVLSKVKIRMFLNPVYIYREGLQYYCNTVVPGQPLHKLHYFSFCRIFQEKSILC
jgi:hypothetical protein